MKNLEERAAEVKSAADWAATYANYTASLLQNLDVQAVERAIAAFKTAASRRSTIYLAGNGGSAATANHFANDLNWGTRTAERPGGLRAFSLAANLSLFSALGNDAGYENVFVEQLRSVFQPHDILFAISASGNSENLIRAIRYCNERDGLSIGLVGFDGGKMKGLCHQLIHIPTSKGEYCPVEDVHMAVCHILSSTFRIGKA